MAQGLDERLRDDALHRVLRLGDDEHLGKVAEAVGRGLGHAAKLHRTVGPGGVERVAGIAAGDGGPNGVLVVTVTLLRCTEAGGRSAALVS